ncbi:helix-turn-helix domain-containing protein [Pontibacter actiniarum]|uniref:Transcriptional regulator n=1 Tax=Pontibacter actiniarum TaxID=323450 RepID=A0A1X9YSM5_9BACT|nr:AraC family transcriptional regulator [Pontibacter actiniarum]ARS35863.1 transcriptional regulator [Pontibacter actiniarum]
MQPDSIYYQIREPESTLTDFVESFWVLTNRSDKANNIVVLPDGRVDIMFSMSPTEPFHASLIGIESKAEQVVFQAHTTIFAASLKLPAIEFLFDAGIAALLDSARVLPEGFWNIQADDLLDFDSFCAKLNGQLSQVFSPVQHDPRKQKLFHLLYASNGALSVQELSDRACWSSRQINRYFNQYFGLSLKAYCNILRFRASLPQIKEGKFFPERDFADQPHFIREIKKFSGVSPKELSQNKNDRFIQFSLLGRK